MTIEEALLRADEGLLGPISCKILAAEVRRLREALERIALLNPWSDIARDALKGGEEKP